MTSEQEATVIVIGAGLSGVCAAKVLQDHDIDVTVLEASDRIGGRLHTIENNQVGYVDVGGAYVGPTQNRVFRWAEHLNLQLYKVYNENDAVHCRKGKVTRFHGLTLPPRQSVTSFLDVVHMLREIDKMGEEIPLDKPWEAKNASKWDRISFQEWCKSTLSTKDALASARFTCTSNLTAEPYEISLLWALWYIKAAGGTARMNTIEGGAQERKFIGGAQQLPEGIANLLKKKVKLQQPVCQVKYGTEGAEVTTVNGNLYKARYVIIAIPPMMQMRINFSPPLPAARNQLIQRMPMGCVIKTIMYYDRPYWKENGFSGTSVVEDDDIDFPVEETMDDSKPDGSDPAIIGFILANNAKACGCSSEEERKTRIAQSYAKLFQCKEMLKPIHYVEKNWSEDPWTGGCYSSFMLPGVLTQLGRNLRKPIGCIYFAGTETSHVWSGYMEGAIQAGERSAREVLYAMGKCKKEDIWKDEPARKDVPVPNLQQSFSEKYAPSVDSVVNTFAGLGLAVTLGLIYSKL